MCGRYSQSADPATLRRRFGLKDTPPDLKLRYNIAPTQPAPVVVQGEGGRTLLLMRWGLIPVWAKDPKIGNKMINARAETILEKPSYKRPFERHRCLVVADGFYEWKQEPERPGKVPMRILLKSREPFGMAGIWDRWVDPKGAPVQSFSIITTSASPGIQSIHDRMPVILKPKDEDQWLDPKVDPKGLTKLLAPFSDDLLEAYPVSTAVNSPKNDVPELVRPIGI